MESDNLKPEVLTINSLLGEESGDTNIGSQGLSQEKPPMLPEVNQEVSPAVSTINSLLGEQKEVPTQNQNQNLHPEAKKINDLLGGGKQDVHSATRTALQAGVEPKSLAYARKHMNDKEYIGWCQKFSVDAAGGVRAPTAADAWNTAKNKVSGLAGIKPGDKIYFYPNHTGIYSGNNKFISGGWGEQDINVWNKNNGQKTLGYIPTEE